MKKVTLLATPLSPYYGMAREFLNQQGIQYDVFVNEDESEIKKQTGQDGELQFLIQELDEQNNIIKQDVVVGMDQERLKELFG